MDQQRQRGFIGPMKVFKDEEIRTCPSRIRQGLRKALEEIAALLCRRQFERLRHIRKESSKAWSNLRQFGCVVPHPPTVVIQAWRLRQAAFENLDERKEGERLVSFVAVSDHAPEAAVR